MADGMSNVIPTVVGGVVALKLLDYAMPDKKPRTVYVVKKKRLTKKEKAHLKRTKKQYYYYSKGKLKKVV